MSNVASNADAAVVQDDRDYDAFRSRVQDVFRTRVGASGPLFTTDAAAESLPGPAAELLDATRNLVDSLNTSLENTDGPAKTELAKSLAALIHAVARRIDG